MSKTLKVRAKALGYYGDIRRKEGDVFELFERTVGSVENRRTLTVEQQFSEKWMEKLDKPEAPTEATKSSVVEEAVVSEPKRAERPKKKTHVI